MAESTSSIKLPTWDGKAATFSVFWLRFKAYAVVKKFLPALQDGREDNLPPDEATELDPEDDDDKLRIKAKEQNALAVALLMMAFMTPSLMMLVHHACDDDWPGGLAWKIVKELLKRYRP